jgi:hypothetical protein
MIKILEVHKRDGLTVHVFRDLEHFYTWAADEIDNFDRHCFEKQGTFVVGNETTWVELDNVPEIEHIDERSV